MSRSILSCIVTFLLVACSGEKEAVLQSDPGLKIPFKPETYLCMRSSQAIVVDGDLNDEAWEQVPWTKDFVDIEGELKPLPALETRVKMLWDSAYFYVAAELMEPHIWATLTQHDSKIYSDDDFEVFIDPNGSTHNYYEYEINALGTDWDLILSKPYRDGGRALDSWEIPGLLKGVKIYGTLNDPSDLDDRWTVELAFPLQVLREYNARHRLPKPGDQWRINFSRVDWHMEVKDGSYVKMKGENGKVLPENNWVWSPQGVIAMHQPETWGYVQFVDQASETYHVHADEEVKWALRQVYYRERAYLKENLRFTSNPAALRLYEVSLRGEVFEPEIQLIPSGFIASHPSIERHGTWYIEADGLIAFTNKTK